MSSPQLTVYDFLDGAASGMNGTKVLSHGDGNILAVLSQWLRHLTHVWSFRAALVFIDVGFLVTQVSVGS